MFGYRSSGNATDNCLGKRWVQRVKATVLLSILSMSPLVHAQSGDSTSRALGQIFRALQGAQKPASAPKSGETATPPSTGRAASVFDRGNLPVESAILASVPRPALPVIEVEPPADEGEAIYNLVKREGGSEEFAQGLKATVGFQKRLQLAAQTPSTLGFKGLNLGTEFQISYDEPNAQGNTVSWRIGDRAPARGPQEVIAPAQNHEWNCWGNRWTSGFECRLARSPDMGTAFGEKLLGLQVTITQPTPAYEPVRKIWQRSQKPRIVNVELEAEGNQFLVSAQEYFGELYKAQPKVQSTQTETSLTPTRAACAAVQAKQVAQLTSDDVRLKRACDNPTTGLLQGMQPKVTSYLYEGAIGRTFVQEVTLVDGSKRTFVTMGHTKYIEQLGELSKWIQAWKADYAQARAKAGKKDF